MMDTIDFRIHMRRQEADVAARAERFRVARMATTHARSLGDRAKDLLTRAA